MVYLIFLPVVRGERGSSKACSEMAFFAHFTRLGLYFGK